jgi:hypothetical protein
MPCINNSFTTLFFKPYALLQAGFRFVMGIALAAFI